MNPRSIKWIPVLLSSLGIGIACFLQTSLSFSPLENETEDLEFNGLRRLEWMTYDLRVRIATKFPRPVSTNLAGVFITDEDVAAINDGRFGYREKFPWPLHFYGKVVNELQHQGASVIGFDVLFDQLAPEVKMADIPTQSSDEFFAQELRKATNVILAAESQRALFPSDLFRTNSTGVGDISAQADSDGTLRRVRAFHPRRVWHPDIMSLDRAFSFDFDKATYQTNEIILPSKQASVDPLIIPLNPDGSINQTEASFIEEPKNDPQMPYRDDRLWHLGIVLAARFLGLDLDAAQINHGLIVLKNPQGVTRRIPIDPNGDFYIDWNRHEQFLQTNIVYLIREFDWRKEGQAETGPLPFTNKIVIIGSAASGNNVADLGATPLQKKDRLVSKHWNVANSIITGTLISRSSYPMDLALILGLGLFSGVVTWRLRAVQASGLVLLVGMGYIAAAFFLYIRMRFWIPLVLPLAGGLLFPHFLLITYRVAAEQRERRRVKAVFAKIVSPDVVNELLSAEKIGLGGALRELSVFFADIRGFTEFTDVTQSKAEEYVKRKGLTDKEAEVYFGEQARETLTTVNLYLSVIAETIKKHQGTLDKYIGDCVMAFWGAPIPNDKHAVCCVRAAIEAQRAVDDLNRARAAQNLKWERDHQTQGSPEHPAHAPLPLLSLGTGVSTGKMTVGLMGSDAHILNYTVFGREVNLASRLEAVSGWGRIIISDATYRAMLRDAPELAATCIEQTPVAVKGIRQLVNNYEVPWKQILSNNPAEPLPCPTTN